MVVTPHRLTFVFYLSVDDTMSVLEIARNRRSVDGTDRV